MELGIVGLGLVFLALSAQEASQQTTPRVLIAHDVSQRHGRPVYVGEIEGSFFFRDARWGDAEWPGMTNFVFSGKDDMKGGESIHIGVGQLKVTPTGTHMVGNTKVADYRLNLLLTNETKALQCSWDGQAMAADSGGHPLSRIVVLRTEYLGDDMFVVVPPGKEVELEGKAEVDVEDTHSRLAKGIISLGFQCIGDAPPAKAVRKK